MKLEKYEEQCPECEGKGCYNKQSKFSITCQRCLGTGKLDWLEKIHGKDPNNVEKIAVKNNTKNIVMIEDLGITLKSNATINIADFVHEML